MNTAPPGRSASFSETLTARSFRERGVWGQKDLLSAVAPLLILEDGDADGVHARRAFVRPDLLPRLGHEALGDVNRLLLRLGPLRRLLPRGLASK